MEITEILDSEGIEYSQNSTHHVLDECPQCGKKGKLFIDKKTSQWICFVCYDIEPTSGAGGIRKLLYHILGFDNYQINKILKTNKKVTYSGDLDFMDVELNKKTQAEEVKELDTVNVPYHFFKLDCTKDNLLKFKPAYDYLFSRFVNTSPQFLKFDLRYNSAKKRIVFPVYDNTKIVGYQSRDITERCKVKHPKCSDPSCDNFFNYYFVGEEIAPERCLYCGSEMTPQFYPKSLNSKYFPKQHIFFNQQNVDWNKPVALVEGPFDSINTENSLALLGKSLSTYQMDILIKNCKELVLYLDGDSAGDESTEKVFNQISSFINVTVCYLEDGDDPGSHSIQDNNQRLLNKISFNNWCQKKNKLYL